MSAPDLVVVAERVLTMSDARNVQVVAVADGRVVSVGSRAELERLAPSGTPILDAGARTVLPGFVDPHAHGEVGARTIATTVDCRAPIRGSVGDVLETLRAHLDGADRGWLVAQGNLFFDQKLAEGRLPTSAELDSVSKETAIALRAGGHVTVLNSRAKELAGIDRGYRPPEHSVTGKPIVERDEDGEPTGVVKEMDNLLPFPQMEAEDLKRALAAGLQELFTRRGVTTVGEISETVTGLRAMNELQGAGDLPLRVFAYLWAPGTLSLEQACSWRNHLGPDLDPLFRVQGVKLFADGGYSAASAAVKCDYAGRPGWSGALALMPDQVGEALARTRDARLQLAIHANGDRAQEEVCAAIAAAGGAPPAPLRTRIEHAGNFAPERAVTTEWWRRAGIIPVPQPVFLYTFGDFFPTYLGPYGSRGRFAFRSLLDEGWRISGSSDVWTGAEQQATNPLFGVWCCVKRQTFRGEIIDPEERVTVDEALRMHTIWAAEALGADDELGSLEPGKLADLIVLDRDPATCPEDDLPELLVDAVVSGGRLAYEREGAAALARGCR